MINGIINIYKEQNYTSHDVVAKLRGILKQKKIGHTGTLDPDAMGVLPVCLGNGTKLCDLLTDKSKVYQTTFVLGVTTDTQDLSGKVIETREVSVTKEQVNQAIYSFLGVYDQIPPMYSALKVDGKKLYELAREGKVIERKSRQVVIDAIDEISIDLPSVTMRVACSKGTYIRTLCHDIGELLGCGASMKSLVRTRVGEFHIEEAFTLAQVEKLRDNGELMNHIKPVEEVLGELPIVVVKEEFRKLIDNGNPLFPLQVVGTIEKRNGKQYRVYNSDQVFCGIYEYNEIKSFLKPFKMFPNVE